MKNFKTAILSALMVCLFSMNAFANNPVNTPIDRVDNALSQKIVNLIVTPTYKVKDVQTATIKFLVTSEDEIVVLRVDTPNPSLESHIKSQLNYQKVEIEGVQKSKPYFLKVTLKE